MFLRILSVVVLLVITSSVGVFIMTRDARYLRFAWLVFRIALIGALVFFGLLALERLSIIPAFR